MSSTSDPGYRASHLAPGRGEEYDRAFELPYRALLWRLERGILDTIVNRRFGDRPFSHLDFACGTGRITTHLQPRAALSVGVDVSMEMMRVAARRLAPPLLVCADITRGHVFGDRRFDLVTAFRFFLNAETDLRREAIAAMAARLAPGGLLVFNNHMNRHSTIALALRAYTRMRGRSMNTLTLGEIRRLVSDAGLRIREVHHAGVLPGHDRWRLLPAAVAEPLERLLGRVPPLRHVAVDQVIVCSA